MSDLTVSLGREERALLPDRERGSRGHAGALVEPERAGRVLRVDVEHDPRGSAPPQFAEASVQEPEAEPRAAPRRHDTDLGDPADGLCIARTELAQTESDDPARGESEQPELGLEGERGSDLGVA